MVVKANRLMIVFESNMAEGRDPEAIPMDKAGNEFDQAVTEFAVASNKAALYTVGQLNREQALSTEYASDLSNCTTALFNDSSQRSSELLADLRREWGLILGQRLSHLAWLAGQELALSGQPADPAKEPRLPTEPMSVQWRTSEASDQGTCALSTP